ncbi:MAG: NADH-quinone oxidoreductase subunit N [Leadbetterella sp.]
MKEASFQILGRDLFYLLPEGVLLFGILLGITTVFSDRLAKKTVVGTYLSLLVVFSFLLVNGYFYFEFVRTSAVVKVFSGLITIDKVGLFYKQMVGVSALIMVLHIRFFKYIYDIEVYILALFMLMGLSFACMSTHFLLLFVSLELVSLVSYTLVSLQKGRRNYEAAIKYFIFGSAVAGVMLFGVSLLYGISHTLDFSEFTVSMFTKQGKAGVQGLCLLFMAGALFKTAAVPFHAWLPDVYENTDTPILSFFSFAPKAVGFLILSRFLSVGFCDLTFAIIFLVVITLLIGNFSALWQNHSKRMLGYSGIAHAGFILIGLLNSANQDFYALHFYVLTYLPMSMGAFWFVDILYQQTHTYDVRTYAGWGTRYRVLGINGIVLMMALVGLPPTIGFTAKLIVFNHLFESNLSVGFWMNFGLITFGLLNMAVSIYYYLRIPFYMFLKSDSSGLPRLRFDSRMLFLCFFSLVLVYFFIFSDHISPIVYSLIN